MTRKTRSIALALALTGLGLTAAAEPAAAFYGSFAASCRNIHIYGFGAYMTAWCRRVDGSWNYSQISNCGGAGVRNEDGYLRCGT